MTKDDFLNINMNIGALPPDNEIRKEYLEKQFSDLGLSKESGYKSIQYYYNELNNAIKGEKSIFTGRIIINKSDNTFAIIDNYRVYIKMTLDSFEKRKNIYFPDNIQPQSIVKSPFSVLEWATIFYYVNDTKLISENHLIKTRMEQFISKHKINTTFNNFKTKYYEAKRRINDKTDYPINKLEFIIPFLKENYKQTVTKVENDIFFLKENKTEY